MTRPMSGANRGPGVSAWAEASPWVASVAAHRTRTQDWYRKYRALIGGLDAAALVAAVGITFGLLFEPSRRLGGSLPLTYAWLAPVLVALWWLVLAAVDSRGRGVLGVGLDEYRRVIRAGLYTFGGVAIASFWFHAELSRALFVSTLPTGIVAVLAGRWLARQALGRLRRGGRALTPAVVVGTAPAVLDVVRETRRNRYAGYDVTAVCLVDGVQSSELEELAVSVLPAASMRRHVASGRYGAVIVADGLSREECRDIAWSLENSPIELMFVPRVMDVAGPRLSVRSMESLSLMHVDLPRFSGGKLLAKRAFDIVFSMLALVLFAPILFLVALLIKLDSPGPVIFRQERIGRYGEPFVIHKFRTMCVDAEEKIGALIAANGGSALLFKLEDDPRITRIGKYLRRYSLDELPQFWTVLRGGMSVVGPRPQVAREVAEYSEIHHRRLLIKPGITGLWQVSGRSELSVEESIRLDLRYVENWSLIGDATIIMKTVRAVLSPGGAY